MSTDGDKKKGWTSSARNTSDYKHLFKILMIGDSGVGKSCILLQFTDGVFSDNFLSTLGVDFKSKIVSVDGNTIKLQIWDTAGQERFRTITNSYYKGADGVVVVYDLTDRGTFDNVKYWLSQIDDLSDNDSVLKILVANKSDMTTGRVVSEEEGKAVAKSLGIDYIETSARNCINVDSLFEKLTSSILYRESSS
eukprot:TRINITY_DN19119_c0_g1_i1.p1 TRINITY_DN19119_c0_g1~~TRINITY_DN19119_c0_g1_i1.p1  ORF type:complete len:223 (+),score=37.73 TRINITY_DN19119_c0_g1_i1:88-669(+)